MKQASVNGIVFDQNKKQVLLTKRRDVPVWVIPGGAIEEGETPEEAVVRELREETQCKTLIIKKIAVYHPINKLTTITHLFQCEIVEGEPKIGDETKEIAFFDIEELPKSFFHVHRDMLMDALKEEPGVIEKKLTQVTYFEFFKYMLKHPARVLRFTLSQLGLPFNT